MTKSLKPFVLDVEVKDVETFTKKEQDFVKLIIDDMRSDGYVPVLDIDPIRTPSYNGKTFDYNIVIYGMYLGKKQAQEIEGVSGSRQWKRLAPTKSKKS